MTSNQLPNALGYFSIFDSHNKKIKDIRLNTSYFNQNKITDPDKEKFLRLKLDEVKIFGNHYDSPSYKFSYSDVNLPSKESYSIDNWGYYNGANNKEIQYYEFLNFVNSNSSSAAIINNNSNSTPKFSTLIPTFNYIDNGLVAFVNGADRDVNKNFIDAGMLKEIIYPTGGKTKFEFEPNTYFKIDGKKNTEYGKIAHSGGYSETFTLYDETFVQLEFTFENHATYESDAVLLNKIWNTEYVLERNDGTDVIRFMPSNDENNTDCPQCFENYTKLYHSVLLSPGTYKLVANNNGFVYFDATIKAKIQKTYNSTTLLGGGIRVKSIQNVDGSGNLYRKDFSYKDFSNKNSGRLMSPVFNFYNESLLAHYSLTNIAGSYPCCNDLETVFIASLKSPAPYTNYLKASGSSFIPLGSSASGKAVGYSQVSVEQTNAIPFFETPNIGKSVYQYRNYTDSHYGVGIMMPNLKEGSHTENGQLTNEFHYNKDGELLKEKNYLYYPHESFKVEGLRVMKSSTPVIYQSPFLNSLQPVYGILIDRFYEEEITWWHPDKIVEKTYFGGNTIESEQRVFYDNLTHKQPTRTEIIRSDGKTLVQKSIYPDDVTSLNSLGQPALTLTEKNAIDKLKYNNLHIINAPIQVETYLEAPDGVITPLSKQRSLYKDWGLEFGIGFESFVFLNKVKTLKGIYNSGSNTFQDILSINHYSEEGNILEVSKAHDLPISYLWGYKNEYPIAKLEGVSRTQIPQSLENDLLNLSNSDNTRSISNTGNEGEFRNELNTLYNLFSSAFVTTYTYDPEIGVTSTTDLRGKTTYFDYNNYNKLSKIIDFDYNLAKKIEYKYSPEIVPDINSIGIMGPDNVIVTSNDMEVSFSVSLPVMPDDLDYYWSISPTISTTYPMPFDSPTVSITFSSSVPREYELNCFIIRPSTGESVNFYKTINVN